MSPTVERDVVFGTTTTGTGQELLCDVYRPDAAAPGFPALPSGRRVGVLVVHGGGWFLGEKEQLESYATGLAEQGYLAVCNSYRLASVPTSRPELCASLAPADAPAFTGARRSARTPTYLPTDRWPWPT